MRTECSAQPFDFRVVEGRRVVAAFDGGAVTSDAGALLLGQPTGRSGWSIGLRTVSRTAGGGGRSSTK
jgi:hypothetical protein